MENLVITGTLTDIRTGEKAISSGTYTTADVEVMQVDTSPRANGKTKEQYYAVEFFGKSADGVAGMFASTDPNANLRVGDYVSAVAALEGVKGVSSKTGNPYRILKLKGISLMVLERVQRRPAQQATQQAVPRAQVAPQGMAAPQIQTDDLPF